VDVWADPATGVAVRVDVTGRGASAPVLSSRFLDLSQRAPAAGPLQPRLAPGAAFSSTDTPDLLSAVGNLGLGVLPESLAGRTRRPLPGFDAGYVSVSAGKTSVVRLVGTEPVGVYGSGLSGFVVLPLPRGLGGEALSGLRNAGGAALTLPGGGTGVAFSTPLVSVVVARFQGIHRTYLLAGLDTPALLTRAVTELAGNILAGQ
jgi:hypothetical protein